MGKKKSELIIEVLAIMFSIIVAFAVDRMYGSYAAHQLEKKILKDISGELASIKEELIKDLTKQQDGLKAALRIKGCLEDPTCALGDRPYDFYLAIRENQLFPESSAFESLKSIGMASLGDRKLAEEISSFYENQIRRVVERGSHYVPDYYILSGYYQANFKVLDSSGTIERDVVGLVKYCTDIDDAVLYPHYDFVPIEPKCSECIKADPAFMMMLLKVIGLKNTRVRDYSKAIKKCEELEDKIQP